MRKQLLFLPLVYGLCSMKLTEVSQNKEGWSCDGKNDDGDNSDKLNSSDGKNSHKNDKNNETVL